jgi:DnaK suppressor protein
MKAKQKYVRLQQTLLRRRDALRRSLSGELQQLNPPDSGGVGDSVDAAVDGDYSEINSQLAQTESRELMRIEHALQRVRQGTYGLCEICGSKIAAVRLQALPYATMCIECQQTAER